MMAKDASRVLDVGNCDPDHGMIRGMLEKNFNVSIDRVMFVDEALVKLRANQYDLVLFNRLIFDDGSEGIELLHRAKGDSTVKQAPIMMISNFEKAQAKSVAAGGVMGFGKAVVDSPDTVALLSRYLSRRG